MGKKRQGNSTALVKTAKASVPSKPVAGIPVDDMGRELAPTREPIIGEMFTPRVVDRRAQIRPPWSADMIIAALEAAENGDMGPQSDLSEAMQDRDAAYLGFRQTRILAPSKLPWSIEPADDSDLAKEVADFVRAEIKSIVNFPLAHRDIFSAVGPGISSLWIDWQSGGRSHGGKPPKSKYRIDGLHYINPKRYRFHWMEEKFLILPDWGFKRAGELGLMNPMLGPTAFAQISGAGIGVEPPPWKVIIHRSRVKSGHPAKAGLDRVCALHFYLRINALNDAAVYCEIYGMPFRIAKYPPGTSPEEQARLAAAMDKLGSDASAIMSNQISVDWLESKSRTGGGAPFFELLRECERQMQLAWLGQDQTNTHNDAGGRTQVAEGGAPIRQDLIEADCIDAMATYTMQLCKPIVGFSDYGWDIASTLCPIFKIRYEPEADYESMSRVDEILYTKLKLPVTVGMLAKRYNRDVPPDTDPTALIDFTPPPMFSFGDPGQMPLDPSAEPDPTAVPPPKKAARIMAGGRVVLSGNFAAETAGSSEHKYASTQVNIIGTARGQALEIAAGIPDDALAEKGREDTPHVTVKYGIDPSVTIDELRAVIGPRATGTLTFGPTAFFASPDADVVFVTVDSPDIVALNKAVTDAVKTTETKPNYVPHLTLAYVKSGRGHEFAGNGAMTGVKFDYSAVLYSDAEGNVTKIQAIRGHVRVRPAKPKMSGDDEQDCPVCVHVLPAHVALTLDGLTICTECRGGDQCHRTSVETFAAAQLHLTVGTNFAGGLKSIDDMRARAEQRMAEALASIIVQAREVVMSAPSLEAIPDRLRAAFPDLDASGLQRLTQRALYVARLKGRVDQRRTPPAE